MTHTPPLFGVAQSATTSDDYYTPAKSRWFWRLWGEADAFSVHPDAVTFANGLSTSYGVFFAAFGPECVEAIGRLGVVRKVAA